MVKKPIKEHVKNYVCAVFKDRLIAEGFCSDNDINWYRIVNNEVIHGVYFYSSYPMLPVVLNIGYGCHPMYIVPHTSEDPYLFGLPGDETVYPGKLNMKANNAVFSMDAQVLCPADEYKGLDHLEMVLSEISNCHTAPDCYALHKRWKSDQIQDQKFYNVSTCFIDEVIYFDDRELYPMCEKWIMERTVILQEARKKTTLWKGHEIELKELELLEQAIIQGKRGKHLQLLEQRAEETRKKMNKFSGDAWGRRDGSVVSLPQGTEEYYD